MTRTDATLQDFTTSTLEEYVFPGTDAATYFVPGEDDDPPPHIRRILDRSSQSRVYPVEGGNVWKVPYPFVKGNEDLFGREPKAWDHEHCDFCDETVSIGERCWTADAPGGGIYLFCRQCREQVAHDSDQN